MNFHVTLQDVVSIMMRASARNSARMAIVALDATLVRDALRSHERLRLAGASEIAEWLSHGAAGGLSYRRHVRLTYR